jgi:hypothetical protein
MSQTTAQFVLMHIQFALQEQELQTWRHCKTKLDCFSHHATTAYTCITKLAKIPLDPIYVPGYVVPHSYTYLAAYQIQKNQLMFAESWGKFIFMLKQPACENFVCVLQYFNQIT